VGARAPGAHALEVHSAGARAFKVGGPNLIVGGQTFLLILALEQWKSMPCIAELQA